MKDVVGYPILERRLSGGAMMNQIVRQIPILAASMILASSAGCQLLGIPSYRSDGPAVQQCQDDCPPGVLPPMPGWLAKWCHKEKVPQPPQHPRFQPLPTRPMFSSDPRRPEGLGRIPNTMQQHPGPSYGRIPTAEGMAPQLGEQPIPPISEAYGPDTTYQGSGTR